MLRKLLVTDENTATVILRFVLGVVFFAHGAQKMLGWFGGYGFSGTMAYFTGPAPIPPVLAFVAIATVHSAARFFMNLTGTQKGKGFEYHLLVLGMTAFLMIRGGGAFSID